MTERGDPAREERVLAVAPTERDAALTRSILTEAGLACHICADLGELCRELGSGAGSLLLTEEVLGSENPEALADQVRGQPAWSDLPVLLLCGDGADSPVAIWAMELLGNVTVLELPVRMTTLVSTVRTALKARRRQYELRKQIDAVRESEGLLRAITDNATTAVFMMDVEGRTTFMNPAAEEMTGFSFVEIEGKILHDQVRHTRSDGRPFPIREGANGRPVLSRESLRGYEDTFVRKDGRMFPVRCAARPIIKDGELNGVVLEVVDITEEVRTLAALRESEERLRIALSAGRMVAWAYDPATDSAAVQETAMDVFGVPHTALNSGYVVYSLVHPDDKVHQREVVNRAIAEGCGYTSQYRIIRPDTGSVQWMEERSHAVTDAVGKTVRLVGVVRDITEEKRVRDELEESSRRKDEFLATLAHELRNPLAPIRNAVQLLSAAGPSDGLHRQLREMVERQVTHLVRLVDDLLEVSRITRGKIQLQRERVDLAKTVQTAVETSAPLIEVGRHHLKLSLPPGPVVVDGDPVRLAQAITNLLNNAAKYTPDEGEIHLVVERLGTEAVICVRDNGPGIPPDMLPRVFELFTQGGGTLQRSQGGLGIGLALVKRLVEMHGGSVEAHSTPGDGAEFVVRLPMAEGAGEMDFGNPSSKPERGGPRRRVLVVDDNVDAADSLSMLLSYCGHEVCTAYDGKTGVEKAAKFKPDVILLDLGMPGMDGYDTAKRVKELPGVNGVRLVALTGWGQEGDRRRTREAGFDGHLVKPVDPAVLQDFLMGPGQNAVIPGEK